jgi:hypothetical protein
VLQLKSNLDRKESYEKEIKNGSEQDRNQTYLVGWLETMLHAQVSFRYIIISRITWLLLYLLPMLGMTLRVEINIFCWLITVLILV